MITASEHCFRTALELNGYTPQVLKPAQILAGFIVSIHASLSSAEKWYLVTNFFPYISGKHLPNAFLKDQTQMHRVVVIHEWCEAKDKR